MEFNWCAIFESSVNKLGLLLYLLEVILQKVLKVKCDQFRGKQLKFALAIKQLHNNNGECARYYSQAFTLLRLEFQTSDVLFLET